MNSSGKAAIKKSLAWWLLRGGGRAKGFDRDSLRRVEGYLDASLGVRPPNYTHALQRPRITFPD